MKGDPMKRMLLFLVLVFVCVPLVNGQVKIKKSITKAQEDANPYPTVSIHDVQYVPYDSLLEVDKVGPSTSPSWLKQVSPYSSYKLGHRDTIEIVGQIIVPPKIIVFTGYGAYNFVLRDTSSQTSQGQWRSVFVRPGSNADTAALFNAGLLSYEVGDIIRIRGYVDEYPTNNTVSFTQFVPIGAGFVPTATMSQCVEYIDTKPVPPVPTVSVGDFMEGTFGPGKVKFSTGEQWEGCYVQLTNLIVSAIVNSANGTFSMVDEYGNEISDMDGSKWFSTRTGTPSSSPSTPYRDPASTYTMPSIGQVIDTIRGYIGSNSGSEASRGYRIYPVFRNDIVYGKVLPNINTHRRTPIAVTNVDTPLVSVKAYSSLGFGSLDTVQLFYSVDDGSWNAIGMEGPNLSDSTYTAKIPPLALNSFVKYFCTVQDTAGNIRMLANAAGGTAWADTSQGFFFYKVSDGNYTIHDVQYTPFVNGASGLLGATVTVKGVVTADTSSLFVGSNGASPWYIQDGNAPWSGLWIYGTLDTLYTLQLGDSISVTGTVQEYLQGTSGSVGRATRLGNVSNVTIIERGKALPEPVALHTGDFAVLNGIESAEAYEGMLVRFDNVEVTDTYPTYADEKEFILNDGTGPVVVRSSDGKNRFTPNPVSATNKTTVLQVGDRFSYVQGIIYFSFNQYKFVPRTDSDFGTYFPVSVDRINSQLPVAYNLAQNYPNPFNPTTKIEFSVPKAEKVTLKVYNILGQEVAKLVDDFYKEGTYKVEFNGSKLPSGMYIYRLQTSNGAIAKKMIMIK